MAAKTIIVLVAFPVLVHAIFTGVTMLLGPVLPSILSLVPDWSTALHKTLLVATFLLAVRVSFGVCRRLWPAAGVK
jgi:hypothetical protein